MATFPHCDSLVLHGKSECRYCDMYPEAQQYRIDNNINFTGEGDPNKKICPAEAKRPSVLINRWNGNQPREVMQDLLWELSDTEHL